MDLFLKMTWQYTTQQEDQRLYYLGNEETNKIDS